MNGFRQRANHAKWRDREIPQGMRLADIPSMITLLPRDVNSNGIDETANHMTNAFLVRASKVHIGARSVCQNRQLNILVQNWPRLRNRLLWELPLAKNAVIKTDPKRAPEARISRKEMDLKSYNDDELSPRGACDLFCIRNDPVGLRNRIW